MSQSAKNSGEFSEEIEVLEGRAGVNRYEASAVESHGQIFPALDFDTAVEHLQRNGYETTVSPNGSTEDVHAEKNGKTFHISSHHDDATEITFMMDVDSIEEPESYVEKVYDRIIGELMDREEKLQTATANYVDNFLDEAEDPVRKLENDFQIAGDSTQEIVSNYFGDMAPTDLFMNYAAQFELHAGQEVSGERNEMPGQMPLSDAKSRMDSKQRNSHYLRRFMKNVLEEADQKYGLSEDLKDYWMDLAD